MLSLLLSTLNPIFEDIIDKIVPDKNAAAKAKASIEAALIEAANKGALAQLEVNKVEAVHRSLFVAGWRPAIGWICAIAIGWTYIGAPIITSIAKFKGVELELVAIDLEYLLELIFGMLGLAGMRSWEKSRGISK
jgi:hypothetical protein